MKSYSCTSLQETLYLRMHSLAFCCLGGPLFIPFYGGDIPFKEVLKMRKFITELNNCGKLFDFPCGKCSSLSYKEWDNFKTFKNICISNCMKCNLNCSYCGAGNPSIQAQYSMRSYETLPVIKSMLESKLLSEDTVFWWGAGEPTLHPEFEEVTTFISRRGYKQVFYSNCVRFSDSLCQTLESKKGKLITSIDCGNRQTFRKIRRADCFDKVINNIQRYTKTNGEVILKFIILPENKNEVEQFVDLCAESGAKEIWGMSDVYNLNTDKVLYSDGIAAYARLVATAAKYNLKTNDLHGYFHGSDKTFFTHIPQSLDIILSTLSDKRFMVWGTGSRCEQYYKNTVRKYSNKFIGYIDSAEKTGDIDNYKIYKPDEVKDIKPEMIFIASTFRDDIINSINHLRIKTIIF